jgi:hypothetical protein
MHLATANPVSGALSRLGTAGIALGALLFALWALTMCASLLLRLVGAIVLEALLLGGQVDRHRDVFATVIDINSARH